MLVFQDETKLHGGRSKTKQQQYTCRPGDRIRLFPSYAVQISSFRFRPDRIFSCAVRNSKQSSYAEKSDLLCVQRFEQTPTPAAVAVVGAAKRRAEYMPSSLGRVNLSWCIVVHNVTDCRRCSLQVRIHGGRCAPSGLL